MKTQYLGLAAMAALFGMSLKASVVEEAPGSLSVRGEVGRFCPLRHTDVQAEISGFLARVTVTQEFENPTGQAIEAGVQTVV